jgi:peptide/nickel transport system substrate-binding protein
LWLVGAIVLAIALSAWGSSGPDASSGTRPPISGFGEHLYGGVRGGQLTVYNASDFGSFDPAEAGSTLDSEIIGATQRPLFSYLPDQTETLSPDLASGPALISNGGRTVTVHIRAGVRFSPPVDREVTSADVAYAIERGANPNVPSSQFHTYFDHIVGASHATGGPIAGIATPNRQTIVFHLTGPYGTFFESALSAPLTAPVPKEFARRLDAHSPTVYGPVYLVATGPYMIKSDASGRIQGVGNQPGQSLTLVRNPNWNASTDWRPAYLNEIDIHIGGDPTIIGRQVLQGSDAVQNDFVAAPIAVLAYRHYFKQLTVVPGAGIYYIALNNRHGPFSNVNVRRALWAALNREEMLRVDGGPLAGTVATHFIYPGTGGYQLAGGATGPAYEFNRYPYGNLKLAVSYLRKAGYPSGRYTGTATIQVVGTSGAPFADPAQIVDQTLRALGFNTHLSLVSQTVMFTKFCGSPAQEIDVCPSSGWTRDFADPQTVLDPTFAGYNMPPSGYNFGQVDDPRINSLMRAGERVLGVSARARAWANIDRQLVAIAAAVPWDFISNPTIESRDVRGVNDLANAGFWDYSFTSLK